MKRTITRARPLRGEICVPGDKSISHRAVLLGALAQGTTTVTGLLPSADVEASLRAVRACGVEVSREPEGRVQITGRERWAEPTGVLDCGNSGTTLRLLTGILAGMSVFAVLSGDESLSQRPMRRLIEPLVRMGAQIHARGAGQWAPVVLVGGRLTPVLHALPVASAQLKTALLLATLHDGACVSEPGASRDHTERMLVAMGATLKRTEGGVITLSPVQKLQATHLCVPGDLSSAAFFLVAASLIEGSDLRLPGVGVNPTRTGILDVLWAMGADITLENERVEGGEPVADLHVRAAPLRGVRVEGAQALRAIDELVVIAIAAAFAQGESVISGASELRLKESDRIASVVEGLRAMGGVAEGTPDGFVIAGGGGLSSAHIDVHGDHRVAMAFAVAALASGQAVHLSGAEAVDVSYPGFFTELERWMA